MEYAPIPQKLPQYAHLQRIGKWLAATALAVSTVAVGAFAVQRITAPAELFAATPEWEQNFTLTPDGPPDPAVWRYDLDPDVPGWNQEQQAYTNDLRNVHIAGGALVLQALREPTTYTNDPSGRVYSFSSGRIDTKGKVSFLYGKIEARMKLAKGEGAWPAFWLLSATEKYSQQVDEDEVEAAHILDGELDVMEQAASDGCKVSATAHTYARRNNPASSTTIVPNCADEFHTYGLEWRPASLTFTVDGKPYHTMHKTSDDPKSWPYDQRMFLILNLAMGGEMGGTIDPSRSQWDIAVQRVSYYPLLRQ